MAIQISGTTVIDNSKNLTNISGYSGHKSGFFKWYIGSASTLQIRVSNITLGHARLKVSVCAHDGSPSISSYYAIVEIFGDTTRNNTGYYQVQQIHTLDGAMGEYIYSLKNASYSYTTVGMGYIQFVQYHISWDLEYNKGNGSEPVVTIV